MSDVGIFVMSGGILPRVRPVAGSVAFTILVV